MIGWLLPVVVAGAAARLYRTRAARRVEHQYTDRFTAAADGVVAGAESFTLTGTTGRGLLLLHGSGDTPQTLRYLAERLHAAGYTVHAPLLPGHGRSPKAFTEVSAAAYLAAARDALSALRRESPWVGVVGLSMGGAIAAQLAVHATDVQVLVLLAPYLTPPSSVRWAASTAWGWGLVVPYMNGRGEASVHDPAQGAASRAYGVFPPNALRALVATAEKGRRALPRVAVPTLVVNSRQDNRIPMALATRSTETLRAPTERHWVAGCGHVITVDYCRDEVAQLVLTFLARHTR
jgi:carboxylesterase